MESLLNCSQKELEEKFREFGFEKYRANQVFIALMQGKTFDEMTNLSIKVKTVLKEKFISQPVEILEKKESKDGTIKFLFKLSDNNIVEGVLMSYKYGTSLCISTQVGCRMGCSFCASTIGGLVRNLTSAEILGQVVTVNRFLNGGLGENRKITNIVIMGSGEPLDNYDNLIKFLNLITDKNGLNFSARNISISTCGLVEKIKQLADEKYQIILTISLHAPTDEIRQKIMAIAKFYKIKDIIDASKYYFKKQNRRVMFEYILIDEINSSVDCAKKLAKLLKGLSAHVNLIILNPASNLVLKPATREQAYAFQAELKKWGISATIRRTLGQDIDGACGQLRKKYLENNTVKIKDK